MAHVFVMNIDKIISSLSCSTIPQIKTFSEKVGKINISVTKDILVSYGKCAGLYYHHKTHLLNIVCLGHKTSSSYASLQRFVSALKDF